MTETELQILKLNCRAEASEALLGALFAALVRTSPNARQSLLEMGNQMRENYSLMSFQGASAEYSDLFSAEFQEAFDSLFSRIEARLEK